MFAASILVPLMVPLFYAVEQPLPAHRQVGKGLPTYSDGLSPDISKICAGIAQDIGFTGESEARGRLEGMPYQ